MTDFLLNMGRFLKPTQDDVVRQHHYVKQTIFKINSLIKIISYVLIFLFIFAGKPVDAQPASKKLEEVKNNGLINLLNNVEILAENRDESSPYIVRIFRLREFGECEGPPQACSKELLYIAVSENEEHPDQKLFMLPSSYGWDFVRWVHTPSEEDPDSYVIFEVTEKVISKGPTQIFWTKEKYDVGVNPYTGFIKIHSFDTIPNSPSSMGLQTSRRQKGK